MSSRALLVFPSCCVFISYGKEFTMPYTVDDLSPVAAVLKAGQDKANDLPPEDLEKLQASVTTEEMNKLFANLGLIMTRGFIEGETMEIVTAFTKVQETALSYMKRALPMETIVGLFDVEGLEPKHVAMLRDLNFPLAADVIERGLALLAAPKPTKPAPKARKRAAPKNTKA
jgi:hypothetical protein